MKSKQDIPVSNLQYETVNINMGPVKGKPSVLYSANGNLLLAVDGKVRFLIVDMAFDPAKLNKEDYANTFKAAVVYLRNDKPSVKKNRSIPLWLENFEHIKTLQIEDVDLENLLILKNIKIKNLIISKVFFENKEAVLNDIAAHKELRNLVYGSSFTKADLEKLKKESPNLKLLCENEYWTEAEKGTEDFMNEWI